ncbi:arylamine N-acetyltransferase [Streptomyces sp. SL13]|uniref:Arylamine N-acetyltransferase n=1 Tax=Streptantibioticus silvisoli TaxID=2705255 RepID=A0AA90KJV9_9ACTN|nr:arylamine N-acetyltransferase [Streptantibioticus silvisoli]MDI5973859.1 arylamine N-acetyltransferase [Streptantibioticus silvisoli]
MDEAAVEAYLARIGVGRPVRTDAVALAELHRRHQMAVPFENLSVHLGEPVRLEAGALVEKIVARRRGGFCYELNGAFAALLTALGYPVTLLAGRVHGKDGRPGPPFDHLALSVEASGRRWLADVGFGRFATHPLLLDERGEQADPGGVFAVTEDGRGDLLVTRDGAPGYLLEPRGRELADFRVAAWWQCTSPESAFTRSLVCSLLTGDGHVTLSGRRLVVTGAAGRRETALPDAAAVLTAYRDHFGIALDHVPRARADTAR